ncbi:hypothetical protein ARMSODRAFT_1012741 [Armillaria solidipes]|uniref:Uncharacterized protein n=1 Tax=Armillaria solidipes TaxID=1076256 RepID=A0A2H3CQN9_9AGAR|nr:hypothetical protein ARMSODRAFT_1012741 [Armillaria solidipes]
MARTHSGGAGEIVRSGIETRLRGVADRDSLISCASLCSTHVPTQPPVIVLTRLALHKDGQIRVYSFVVVTVLMSYKGITAEITVFTAEHSKTTSTLKNHSKMFDEMTGKTASKQFKKDEVRRDEASLRSPHIFQLLEYLENTTKHDYVVETTPGKSDDAFSIKFDEVPGVVAFIHTYAQGGPRVRSAREQLMRKYGEPLWNRMHALVRRGLPFPVPEVSRQDVEAIIKAFKVLKRFTHILSVVGQRVICVIVRFPEDATPLLSIPVPTPNLAPTLPTWNAVGPNFNLPEPKHYDNLDCYEYIDLAHQKR